MSQVLIDPSSLTAIGEAIRSKNKQTVKYKPNEMAGAIKALALDNSVTIQSNDAWKYAIDSTLEHQSITVKVSGKLTGDNTTGYKGEVIFDPYITSNFGWLAGKITKTVDNANHIITFSAEAATEISGMLQDGWTPVYVVDGKYYTTTTPDDISSLKSVSSSDNIENLLICGYYTLDKSTNKLVATEPTTMVGPVSKSGTENYQNKYIKEIYYREFANYNALTTVDISNATNIKSYAFDNCDALTTVDISNAISISSDAFNSAIKYIILNNNTPPDFGASSNDVGGLCFLIPQTAFDAYISKWSSIYNILDYIESYDITRANCTITVKLLVTTLNFSINKTNTKKVDVAANTGDSYEFSTFNSRGNVFFYNANYMCIVSYYEAFGAKFIRKAVSLKITRASDNSGGTFTIKEPSKDIYDFGSGCGARFNLSTYVEGNPGCSINDLKTAFENGETLNFEMKIQ